MRVSRATGDHTLETFYQAIRRNCMHDIQVSVSLGVDINHDYGMSLYIAAGRSKLYIVKYMLSLGIDAPNSKSDALYYSARTGRSDVVEYILSVVDYDLCTLCKVKHNAIHYDQYVTAGLIQTYIEKKIQDRVSDACNARNN